jgi:CRP/FNR family transcriptional regulator
LAFFRRISFLAREGSWICRAAASAPWPWEPKLGLALAQALVERCIDLEERMEGLALYKTPQRVAWALLRFAERLGVRDDDGSLKMPPITHQLMSEFIGTSREIVTFQMNQLRRQGFVRYSRKAVHVYKEALEERMKQPW